MAYSRIVVPESKNVALDLQIDELLLKAGARMGERERLEYYGRPLIGEDDLAAPQPGRQSWSESRTRRKTSPSPPKTYPPDNQ